MPAGRPPQFPLPGPASLNTRTIPPNAKQTPCPPAGGAPEATRGGSTRDPAPQTHSHVHLSVRLSHTQTHTQMHKVHPQMSLWAPPSPKRQPLPRRPCKRQTSGACSQQGFLARGSPACSQAAILRGHTKRLYSGEKEQQSTFSWLGAMNVLLS